MQLVRSFQVGELTRRQFVVRATAALGSASAANLLLAACAESPNPSPPPVVVEPTAAEPMVTEGVGAAPERVDMSGLARAESVVYGSLGEQALSGYYVEPEGASGLPAVVMIQEWWGLNPHIEDMARRLAREGFVVLAPDLYHGAVTTEPDEARKLVMALDQVAAVQEIEAAADYLLGQDAVSSEKAGVTGFCMGGGLSLQAGLASPERFGAVVAFYGSPLSVEDAAGMQVPTLGLYGADDNGIPVADVRAQDEAFETAGIPHELVVYDGAGHAFMNDTRESFAPEAAADGWARLLDWFATHL
ncbi:MAG: dienelactone hydrolase family protein [Caldilineae bacterium]|nr:dienelactone hydrolase family protein [Caldilineae bacterium]